MYVRSQFPVRIFEPCETYNSDIVIREGMVMNDLKNPINKGVAYQSNTSEFLLHVTDLASFYVKDGKEITVMRKGNTSADDISAFLAGTVMGAVLHQRCMLPLHACSVVYKGKCLVFAGVSGSGKSTLAAAFVKNGARLISDDIPLIEFLDNKPFVRPSYPVMKVWKDSLKHLNISCEGLQKIRGELKKYYLPVTAFQDQKTLIDHVFILNIHNKGEVIARSLQGIHKFNQIKGHTYFFGSIRKTGLERNHFILAGKLANSIPVTLLLRPMSLFNTGNLIGTIENTVMDKWNE